MNNPLFTTRRDFLRTTLLGGALTWTVPSFVAQTFSALHAEADGALTQVATGKDGPILVLIQLAGGNDGLNAVVPYTNDYYYKARPTIGIPANQVLTLNDTLGLNPAMTGFKSLFDAGHLSIVNGVGYPNPNRSHFRSTEIWQTASDEDKYLTDGWLGRYFDNACQGCDPDRRHQHRSARCRRLFPPTRRPASAGKSRQLPVHRRGPRTTMRPWPTGACTPPTRTTAPSTRVQTRAAASAWFPAPSCCKTARARSIFWNAPRWTPRSARIKSAPSPAKPRMPRSIRAPAWPIICKLVARLIAGGLPTRVFYVSQGGYDTHTGQRGGQDGRLRELGDAVKAFTDDLTAMGEFDRVMIMTFSEFGRRVQENGSQGTDHGAAAPMFLIGSHMKAGLLGAEPSLAPADLTDGDIKYNTDFRSVYASILQDWLKTNSAPILGKQFPTLPIVT